VDNHWLDWQSRNESSGVKANECKAIGSCALGVEDNGFDLGATGDGRLKFGLKGSDGAGTGPGRSCAVLVQIHPLVDEDAPQEMLGKEADPRRTAHPALGDEPTRSLDGEHDEEIEVGYVIANESVGVGVPCAVDVDAHPHHEQDSPECSLARPSPQHVYEAEASAPGNPRVGKSEKEETQ